MDQRLVNYYDGKYSGTGYDYVTGLMKDGFDPSIYDNFLIRLVALKGDSNLMKLLLADKRVDPTDVFTLGGAAENGHAEIVELLLKDPRINPTQYDNVALEYAVNHKRVNVVKLLLEDDRVRRGPMTTKVREYIKNF